MGLQGKIDKRLPAFSPDNFPRLATITVLWRGLSWLLLRNLSVRLRSTPIAWSFRSLRLRSPLGDSSRISRLTSPAV